AYFFPLAISLSRCAYSASLPGGGQGAAWSLSIPRESAWHIGDLGGIPPGKKGRSEQQPSQTGGTDHGLHTALGPKCAHKGRRHPTAHIQRCLLHGPGQT